MEVLTEHVAGCRRLTVLLGIMIWHQLIRSKVVRICV